MVGMFYEKALQSTSQKDFRVGRVIKRKVYKLYVKWKDFDSFFSCWIDKKGIV